MKTAVSTIRVNSIYKNYAGTYKGRYLFMFGGGGSGKSVYAMQKLVKRLVQEDGANHRILVIRKVARTLKDSVYESAKSIIKSTGFERFCKFKFSQGENYIEFKPNGNRLIFLGLDDPEKIKSITGVTSIFIEEVTELSEKDFLQLDLRLRGETKYYKQIIACFNPVSKDHWLLKFVEPQLSTEPIPNLGDVQYLEGRKVWEFKLDKNRELTTRTINTTSQDNQFLDDDYREMLATLGAVDEVHHTVYTKGRWGRIIDGTQYITTFKESIHLAPVRLDQDLPIHYTVDFNVAPYMSGIVAQLEYIEGDEWNGHESYYHLKIAKEYALKKDKATANHLGESLANDIELIDILEKGFFLYGDASGMNRLGIKDTKNLFADLKRGLADKKFLASDRIPTTNPRYKRIAPNSLGRRAFINLLFTGKLAVRITIDPNCHELINDLKYCTSNANGAKEKKKVKGIEPRGHMLDALEYFICHPKSIGHLATIK